MEDRIDRLRRAFDAFNTTGAPDTAFLAPDFEMRQASSIVDTAGVFTGPTALRDSLQELQESFDGLRFEAERLVEAPTDEIVVIVRVTGRGRGSGMEVDNRIGWVMSFRGEQATRLVVYEEPREALKAAGLETGDAG